MNCQITRAWNYTPPRLLTLNCDRLASAEFGKLATSDGSFDESKPAAFRSVMSCDQSDVVEAHAGTYSTVSRLHKEFPDVATEKQAALAVHFFAESWRVDCEDKEGVHIRILRELCMLPMLDEEVSIELANFSELVKMARNLRPN